MKKLLMVIMLLVSIYGCGGNGSVGADDGNGGTITGSAIQFDLSDAVAIMKADETTSAQIVKASATKSNIFKLTTTGAIEDVFTEGEAIVASKLYVAPDGKPYLLFSSPITVNNQQCILLRLSRNNTSECVDDTLQSISEFSASTKPIQFDEEGNIYYSGFTDEGKRVLRKKSASLDVKVDLINDNISIDNFLITNDGVAYLSGQTESTKTNFFRKILTSGALVNLLNGADIMSLYELPDNNIYAGEWGERFGVLKISPEGVSSTLYIGYTSMNGVPHTCDFNLDSNSYNSCVEPNAAKYEDFCGMGGTILSTFYRSPDDHVYVVAGTGDTASLWQYWPEVKPIDTSVYRPTIVSGTMTTLLIAGYDASNKNKLISYNTADASEIDLLNGVDIEIYHFSYLASTGKIIFNGLRFSDNTYIVGSIDTQNGNTLTILETGIRYEDLQFFE